MPTRRWPLLYEYVLENGVWKLYWGGKAVHETAKPAETPRVVMTPRVEAARREEPALVIQA
jgi:hypothetical protein